VWFSKDATPATAAAPQLHELLAGPTADVLPASLTTAHAAVSTAAPVAAVDHSLLQQLDEHKPQPLI